MDYEHHFEIKNLLAVAGYILELYVDLYLISFNFSYHRDEIGAAEGLWNTFCTNSIEVRGVVLRFDRNLKFRTKSLGDPRLQVLTSD